MRVVRAGVPDPALVAVRPSNQVMQKARCDPNEDVGTEVEIAYTATEGRMSYRIWEWGELTQDVIRTWGYDEELFLLQQDEDLLLYEEEFIPVILELAGDDQCPK